MRGLGRSHAARPVRPFEMSKVMRGDSQAGRSSPRIPLSPVGGNCDSSDGESMAGQKRKFADMTERSISPVMALQNEADTKKQELARIVPVKMDRSTVEWIDHYKNLFRLEGQPEGSRHDFVRVVIETFA